jgi:hypothetical protein
MSKLVLRNERAIGRAAEHEDVEPACVIGEHQRMLAEWSPFDGHPDADDPSGRGKKAARPFGAAEDGLGDDVNRREDRKKSDKPRDAQDCPSVQPDGGPVIGRG